MNNKFKIALIALTVVISQSGFAAAESIKTLEEKVMAANPAKFTENNWYDYKRGFFIASQENKNILLSFCVKDNPYCLKLQDNTYTNPEIKKFLSENFVTIRVDGAANNLINFNDKNISEKDLIKQYAVEGFPTIAFLNPQGKVIGGSIKGFIAADKFLPVLKYIASDSYKNIKFKDFLKMQEKNTVKETPDPKK